MEHKYWCEKHRDGEIDVSCGEEVKKIIADGKAVQFYCFDYKTLKERMNEKYPEADVYYTERNGDSIAMLVPKGTDVKLLPTVAMDYIAFEWIDPDKDFGTGIRKQIKKLLK